MDTTRYTDHECLLSGMISYIELVPGRTHGYVVGVGNAHPRLWGQRGRAAVVGEIGWWYDVLAWGGLWG